MIFDGEKKVYILSEQEYDEMFDGEAHANLELIKKEKQLQEANELLKWVVKTSWTGNQEEDAFDRYIEKWGVK